MQSQSASQKGTLHTFVPSSSLRCRYRGITFARLWSRYRRTDFTFAPPSSLRCGYRRTLLSLPLVPGADTKEQTSPLSKNQETNAFSIQGNMKGLLLHTFVHPPSRTDVTFASLWYRRINFTFAPPSSLRYRYRRTDFTFVYKLGNKCNLNEYTKVQNPRCTRVRKSLKAHTLDL